MSGTLSRSLESRAPQHLVQHSSLSSLLHLLRLSTNDDYYSRPEVAPWQTALDVAYFNPCDDKRSSRLKLATDGSLIVFVRTLIVPLMCLTDDRDRCFDVFLNLSEMDKYATNLVS